MQDEATVTLRIETISDQYGTIIRLSGRMQAEHLEELEAQIKDRGYKITLDLEEVGLVDVAAVRFLGVCKIRGAKIIHCSPYISDWIAMEQGQER